MITISLRWNRKTVSILALPWVLSCVNWPGPISSSKMGMFPSSILALRAVYARAKDLMPAEEMPYQI